MTTQSTGLASIVPPVASSIQQPQTYNPTDVEPIVIPYDEPEHNVQQPQLPNLMIFNPNTTDFQPNGPQLVAQPSVPHHVPYLLNQAQHQFALMEQQYAQHIQQEQHQEEISHRDSQFTMDMGDSDSGSLQLQPEAPVHEEPITPASEPPIHNPHVDLSSVEHTPVNQAIATNLSDSPAIPISHLLAHNAYPSLTKPVPASIAQSFAPIFVQPLHPAQQGGDIYNDYVQDPYNLVLQSQTIADASNYPLEPTVSEPSAPTQTAPPPIANVFQSANYFGSDQSARIPPGSEMLFSSP